MVTKKRQIEIEVPFGMIVTAQRMTDLYLEKLTEERKRPEDRELRTIKVAGRHCSSGWVYLSGTKIWQV